jgi:hypothetical protein
MESLATALFGSNSLSVCFRAFSLLKPYPPDDIEGDDESLLVDNTRHHSPKYIPPDDRHVAEGADRLKLPRASRS